MNACMHAKSKKKKKSFLAKSLISRRINEPVKLIPRAFCLIKVLQFIFHCKVMGCLYSEPSNAEKTLMLTVVDEWLGKAEHFNLK